MSTDALPEPDNRQGRNSRATHRSNRSTHHADSLRLDSALYGHRAAAYNAGVNNFAFIDGQNLYSGVQSLGWSLELRAFRVHLRQKYRVTRAFYFIGYMPANQSLYRHLQHFGYELVFKPVVQGAGHDPKGNVDADLVLRTMIELPNYDQAVIVSEDGDYSSLVDYLDTQGKLFAVVAPNRRFCSSLLRRSAKGKLRYVEDVRNLVERTW